MSYADELLQRFKTSGMSSGPSILFEVPDMNRKALQSFEMLGTVCVCAAVQCHIPEVLNLQKDRCENLKSDSEYYMSDTI
jgi:hypothetical protein